MSQTTVLVRSYDKTCSSIESSDDKISVFRQLKDFRSQIPRDLLSKWETPSGLPTIRNIVRDWAIILASSQLYIRWPSVITFAIATLLISWGQRGISNLAHDSIHRNLVAKKKWNDIIADVFLAPAFLTTAKLQREAHTAHHHYLGTAADPDHGINNETSLKHYRTGHEIHSSIYSLFIYDLLDPRLWYQNAIGSLRSAPLFLATWWSIVAFLAGLIEPNRSATIPVGYKFIFLYHFTRLTLSHIFYVLRETIDHSGLSPTSILDFTRSSPCCNVIQAFLQPHDDNYHLLHHLLPRIPMTRLHEAHVWLVDNCEIYREASTRSENYFSGENPLFGELVWDIHAGFDDDTAVLHAKRA